MGKNIRSKIRYRKVVLVRELAEHFGISRHTAAKFVVGKDLKYIDDVIEVIITLYHRFGDVDKDV